MLPHYKRCLAAVVFGLTLSSAVSLYPCASAQEAARKADDLAIRTASKGLAQALEKGDAKAVAAFWTDEGEYVGEGQDPLHGRASIEKAYTAFFAKRQAVKLENKSDAIRYLGKDTALEEGTFTTTTQGGAPVVGHFSALHVRQDGKWQIAMLKEWSAAPAAPQGLEALTWLIGVWESDGEATLARTTYEWIENKKFIRAQYAVSLKKEKNAPSTGTQIIGIDPATGQIRAWTFDASGSVGEATWEWDGERWVIDSAGSAADGSETTAVNFLAPAGKDAFTWRSVRRTLDGDHQPDLPVVKVKRVASSK